MDGSYYTREGLEDGGWRTGVPGFALPGTGHVVKLFDWFPIVPGQVGGVEVAALGPEGGGVVRIELQEKRWRDVVVT